MISLKCILAYQNFNRSNNKRKHIKYRKSRSDTVKPKNFEKCLNIKKFVQTQVSMVEFVRESLFVDRDSSRSI